jgi:hypothetical protein
VAGVLYVGSGLPGGGREPCVMGVRVGQQDRADVAERVAGAFQVRSAELYGLLAQAGPEVTQMLATTQQERPTGVRALVTHLADADLLAAGRDPATAADACWALTGPRMFLNLTTDRGWQPGQYEDWLTGMLTANLLAPASNAPAPSQKDAT